MTNQISLKRFIRFVCIHKGKVIIAVVVIATHSRDTGYSVSVKHAHIVESFEKLK